MNFILGYHFAFEYMSHEQIIVHRFRNDLCDRGRVELEERIMLRLSGLRIHVSSFSSDMNNNEMATFLFRDTRSRNTSPNCEK